MIGEALTCRTNNLCNRPHLATRLHRQLTQPAATFHEPRASSPLYPSSVFDIQPAVPLAETGRRKLREFAPASCPGLSFVADAQSHHESD